MCIRDSARRLRSCLRECDLGIAEACLRRLMRLDQRRLSRVVRGNILRQALHFGVERSQGGMGVARQFAFARPVLGEPRLLRRQIVEPLPRGTFLALQSDLSLIHI